MANEVEPKLIKELFVELQSERYVTLSTIDYQTNGPNVSAISWILAKNEQTLVFAVDKRSRIILNIKNNPLVAISLVANESTYAILGKARIVQEGIDGVPLKLAMVEVKIDEVRDVMFYGSKMVSGPVYNKAYDEKAAERLDNQVMQALKKA